MNYYIADLHLGNSNIIKYEHRPFKSAEIMASTMIDNINKVVRPEDTIYFLGDVIDRDAQDFKTLAGELKNIKCNKVLICGNHDRVFIDKYSELGLFSQIKDYLTITDNDSQVILSHYPIEIWENNYRGSIHLHGHLHRVKPTNIKNRFNVGVDATNFKPVTLKQLLKNTGNDSINPCTVPFEVKSFAGNELYRIFHINLASVYLAEIRIGLFDKKVQSVQVKATSIMTTGYMKEYMCKLIRTSICPKYGYKLGDTKLESILTVERF